MYAKNGALSQLFTVTGPKSQVAILFQRVEYACTRDFPAIKNETASSGIPEAARHHSDLDLIIPEYTHPSGFFGVPAGACIRQNTVCVWGPRHLP